MKPPPMKRSTLPLLVLAGLLPHIESLAASVSPTLADPPSCNCAAPYPLVDVDQQPEPLSQTPPLYPAGLKAAKIQGNALIELVIDEAGETRDVQCIQETTAGFGASAITAVQQWRFHPATKAGLNVACRLRVPIVFSIPQ